MGCSAVYALYELTFYLLAYLLDDLVCYILRFCCVVVWCQPAMDVKGLVGTVLTGSVDSNAAVTMDNPNESQ